MHDLPQAVKVITLGVEGNGVQENYDTDNAPGTDNKSAPVTDCKSAAAAVLYEFFQTG